MVGARTIAVALLVAGALAFAFPTLATEGFNTERPTSFAIGSEDDALIAAEATGNTVTNPGQGNPTVVGRVRNNFDSELTMTYRVRTTDGAIEPDPERDTVTLLPGERADITVRCAPPGEGGGESGTAVVTVTVESAQAGGIGVENAEFEFDVTYDCVSGNEGQGKGDGDDESDEGKDEGDDDGGNDGEDGDSDDGDGEGKDKGQGSKGKGNKGGGKVTRTTTEA